MARQSGVKFTHVPTKGGGESIATVLGKHITAMVESPAWTPMVDSGQFRLLMMLGPKSKKWPDAPTLKELGYNDVFDSPFGLAGPKGMDPAIVKKLHDAFKKASDDPKVVELYDKFDFVRRYMSMFGVGEILTDLEHRLDRELIRARIGGLLPTRGDWAQAKWPIVRGTVLGFFLGVLPGGGAVIAAFASYALERRVSATPQRFGTGAIEGVAGPGAANNAAAGGAFIPLLTLGIPPNVVMALLLGALVIHGLQPGPLMMVQRPDVFWGIVASMYIGNVMLLVLNMPLIGMWVQVLKVPYRVMFPLILMFCVVGVFASGAAVFDVFVMVVFGVLGYLMRQFGYEPAPLVLAFVLGPMLENNLRKSLILSQGDFMVFIERPISAVFLALTAAVLVAPLLPALARRRAQAAPSEP